MDSRVGRCTRKVNGLPRPPSSTQNPLPDAQTSLLALQRKPHPQRPRTFLVTYRPPGRQAVASLSPLKKTSFSSSLRHLATQTTSSICVQPTCPCTRPSSYIPPRITTCDQHFFPRNLSATHEGILRNPSQLSRQPKDDSNPEPRIHPRTPVPPDRQPTPAVRQHPSSPGLFSARRTTTQHGGKFCILLC
jgi:hypothetical protein